MAIAKVQAFTKAGSASESPGVLTVTASTTVGNHIVLMVGCSGGRTVTGVTDSKGNTWTVHYTAGNSSFVGCSVASAKITTQLVNGDTISITPSAAGFIAAVAQEYSGFDPTTWLRTKAANGQGWVGSTSATGGATAGNSTAGDLVIGALAGDNAFLIATPGAGYTNETGVSTTTTVITLDWESKTAAGGSTETATATWSGIANGAGGTIVFAPAPPAATGGAVPRIPTLATIPTLG